MSGLTFFLSTRRANERWDPARTGLGYEGHCAPYDVTPELRFAMVDDPNGNTILLSAGTEAS